jgi:hypothetical protein
MRFIAPGEECLSASAIVERFAAETGHALHATNAGQAAKELDLDYIEVDAEPPPGAPWADKERRYAVLDVPLIMAKLRTLVDRRARYAPPTDA